MKLWLLLIPLIVSAQEQMSDLSLDYRKKQLTSDPNFSAVDNLRLTTKSDPKLKEIVKEKPPGEPEVFHIYLKKGTKIKDVKYNYTKTIYRDIYVKAIREYPTSPFFNIMDKKGIPRYQAQAGDVKYINETIDLNPTPKKFEVQTKSPQNKAYDKKARFEHTILLNRENWESSYFNVLTKDISNSNPTTFKVDYKFYHLWDFPLNLGVIASYENGSWDANWRWNSMYLGLGLKIPWNISSWFAMEWQITWQTSLFFSFTGEKDSYQLSNDNLTLSGEWDFKTSFGTYFIIGHFRKIYWSANEQSIAVPAQKRDSSALGVGVGVKFKSIINL